MQVSLLQCQSSRDVQANLAFIESQLERLPRVAGEPQLVVLPECCLLFGGHESEQLAWSGEDEPLKQALAALAAHFGVYLVAGTVPARSGDGRVYSRCYVFDDAGTVLGHYEKIHLFDVDVADGTKTYRESDTFCPGDNLVVVDTPFGKLGLAICYDVRFPDMFRALRLAGAEIIALPAAFTRVTGEAHWEILLKARAIESQCFVLGAAQWGAHNTGSRETWGQSMIIDPWGRTVAELAQGTGWVQARLDRDELARVRTAMPVASHDRFKAPELLPAKAGK
ncbi:carbon-nitrogen hydrolase family protein [Shewanella litorisediminis]|uniref:Carbon-nitrogen hydrolase family protein n=1 Tax=Shewanella litorisediminis TaxID=1173586 RepID=A0ABX7G4N0_9GAMM|nr:carbon-nitrogen hydrolase family protein [Shewanella litorisediminis]MCL2917831.1 carbon-nitrogen hydrolase family protein [Shewanella litorisediminis]QRH02271.1 carbon-nitrogen hydrolase family protein [Shewanella litorisediminis]